MLTKNTLVSILIFVNTLFSEEILKGSGATFPSPLYQKWITEYSKISPDRITYKATGSGEGINQICKREVDFAGTDAFLTDEEMTKDSCTVIHVPTCLGAVVLTYNLELTGTLKMTPDIIADIFLGKIREWSDKRIKKVNNDLKLPDLPIVVIHRSDKSGTTFLFTNYLSKVSTQWNESIHEGKTVRWPVGLGVEGNTGVSKYVQKISGSIGYVEMGFARALNLKSCHIRNSSGMFIAPSVEAVSSAGREQIPDDTRILITNTSTPSGYPISGFTYLILFREQRYNGRSRAHAQALINFLNWTLTAGQQHTTPLHYAPLPKEVISKTRSNIQSLTYNGFSIN